MTTTKACFTSVLSLVLLACLASTAHAQQLAPLARPWDGTTAIRLYALGSLGVFGEARAQSGTMRTGADVAPSPGGAIGVEIPLAHAFSIGFEANVWSWSVERPSRLSVQDSLLLEVSVVPRFRNPWTLATGEHFAIDLALPIGPSASFLHSADQSDALSVLGVHDGRGGGMHAGAFAEIQAFVLPHVGVTLDVGYLHHFLWHPSTIPFARDVLVDFGQAVVRLGVIVAI